MNNTLCEFPALAAALPNGFPTGRVKCAEFDAADATRKRAGGLWHAINLPYVLYMANQEKERSAHDLGRSLLETLDEFCATFVRLEGFKKVVAPLFGEGVWNLEDPRLWEVVAVAHASLHLRNRGYEVRGFELLIPQGKGKRADIVVARGGEDLFVDVVMKHRTTFTTKEAALTELQRHADDKIGTKYGPVLESKLPVSVLVVCVVQGRQLDVLLDDPDVLASVFGPQLERREGVAASFWALAGIRDRAGRLRYVLLTRDDAAATGKRQGPPEGSLS